MLLYIIRHGETKLNVEGRLQGVVDEPLNEKGVELARVTGQALKDVPFDFAISSPLARAYRTAEILVEENTQKNIPIKTDPRLEEFDWGKWDTMCILPVNYELPVDYKPFFKDPFSYENLYEGETVQDVIKRVEEFYRELIENPDNQDKVILLSTHGCALRAMLNHLYDDPLNFWQDQTPPNCCINIIQVEDGQEKILEKDRIFYDPSLIEDHYGDA